MLTVTIAINNADAESEIKALLASPAIGLDVGATDAQASAALSQFVREWLREQLRSRRRQPTIDASTAQALDRLDTLAGRII